MNWFWKKKTAETKPLWSTRIDDKTLVLELARLWDNFHNDKNSQQYNYSLFCFRLLELYPNMKDMRFVVEWKGTSLTIKEKGIDK
jgi:hypothetical protein